MANRHTKTCSILLIFREMPIKTTVRYHLPLVRIAIIKKQAQMTSIDEGQVLNVEKREILMLC